MSNTVLKEMLKQLAELEAEIKACMPRNDEELFFTEKGDRFLKLSKQRNELKQRIEARK